MKICLLFQNDFPPDPRVSRTLKTLSEAGHQVELFCDNRHTRPHCETIEGVLVTRIKTVASRAKGWRRLAGLPIFWNPIWMWQFLRFVKSKRFDALHAVNLTMLPLGFLCARLMGVPVIYDMHENYPAALRSWRLKGWFNRIFKSAALAEKLDRFFIRRVDRIIVVVEEAAEYVIRLGARPENIAVVYNTTDVQKFFAAKISKEIVRKYRARFTLVYTGVLSPDRGLEVVLEAVPLLLPKIPNLKLVIAGGGASEMVLRKRVEGAKLQDFVEITGWVDPELFPSYIAAASIGIVPHLSDPYIDSTMANKLFDYMTMGKPVVVSDAKPLARVVRECACGWVFSSGSAASFADAVFLARDDAEAAGQRGRRAVMEKYNWAISSRVLAQFYARLEHSTR